MPVNPDEVMAHLKGLKAIPITFVLKDTVFTREQVVAAVDDAKKAVDAQMTAEKVLGVMLGIAKNLGAIM